MIDIDIIPQGTSFGVFVTVALLLVDNVTEGELDILDIDADNDEDVEYDSGGDLDGVCELPGV